MGHLALGVLHKRMFTKSQLTMLMAAALPIDADSELVSEPEIQLPVAANGKLEHWASMPAECHSVAGCGFRHHRREVSKGAASDGLAISRSRVASNLGA